MPAAADTGPSIPIVNPETLVIQLDRFSDLEFSDVQD